MSRGIILTEKEFTDNNWWYADGSQPISNGELGKVVDKNKKPIYIISCCSNCGDYNVMDTEDLIDDN